MAAGDGSALVLIRHSGIGRKEITDTLRRRWPDLWAGSHGMDEPPWKMPITQVVSLTLARRGIEPLRIVVLPQRRRFPQDCGATVNSRTLASEPMPWTF
jgi:hypothetical protein